MTINFKRVLSRLGLTVKNLFFVFAKGIKPKIYKFL